jgi:SAM-dependent methyltransferase
LDFGIEQQKRLGYWEARKHFIYYKSVFQYACVAGADANSVIDIGSASAEYVNWLKWIPNRFILDYEIKSAPVGVQPIETDFFEFDVPEKFDLALCCQVLEHVEDPKRFCEKLKSVAKKLIITVPYRWSGAAPGHINDPVDEDKLYSWISITPNSQQIVCEPFRESRLISYYDLENGPSYRFDKQFIFESIAKYSEHAP